MIALNKHLLFGHLTSRQLYRLIENSKKIRIKRNTILFRSEDESDQLYLVERGCIALIGESKEGHNITLDLLQPGELIAENTLFSKNRLHKNMAQSVTNSDLLVISKTFIKKLMYESSLFNQQFIEILSEKSNRLIEDRLSLQNDNAKIRIYKFFSQIVPKDAKDEHCLYLDIPKKIIASRLSMKPETLSRAISKLKSEKVIDVKGRKIKLLNTKALS